MEVIAPATSDDVPRLAAPLNLLFTHEADFKPDPEGQERGLRLIIESPHVGVGLAACDGGGVVGMVSLLCTPSAPPKVSRPAGWRTWLFTPPAATTGGVHAFLQVLSSTPAPAGSLASPC